MQPTYLPLVKIFGSEIRHTVPLFQRPYVWSREEQWEPLWDDISNLADRVLVAAPDKPIAGHFLGTVVLEQASHRSGSIPRREVIDGQQRLTTLQILLKATEHALAKEHSDAMAENDEPGAKATQVAERQIAALTANPAYAEDEERYKVWPTNEDRASFRQVMDYAALGELSRTRFAEAYFFFLISITTWLRKGGRSERAMAFASALKDHLRLIVLDLDNTDEPQAIFETLNAHGTPLLPADLMKNWLLWEGARGNHDLQKLYESYWQPFDTRPDYWRAKVGAGHAARARIDTFLQNWLTRRTRENIPTKHLYQAFLRHAAPKEKTTLGEAPDVEALMRDIRADGVRFERIDQPAGTSRFDTFLQRLKILDVVVFHPVLLAVMGRVGSHSRDLDDAAVVLESYLVRRMVCGQQTRSYGALALELLKAVDGVEAHLPATPALASVLVGGSTSGTWWPDDDSFRRDWCTRRFYGNLRRERVLMMLQALEEYYQRESVKGEPIVQFNFSTLQIEHILPQQWTTHWPLPAIEGAESNRTLRLNGIGNLTLVSGRLNPSLSNAPWLDPDPGKMGKRNALDAHSKLQLNARLVKANPDHWDEAAIEKRAHKLCDAAIEVWPGPQNWLTHAVPDLSSGATKNPVPPALGS